ncbi:hypothetical protein ACWDYH_35675 [Nocardia goodfellowii]
MLAESADATGDAATPTPVTAAAVNAPAATRRHIGFKSLMQASSYL